MSAPSFADLLASVLTAPGKVHAAYTAFHGYSLGNQLLAWAQCDARGIALGPIATFPRWKELGRHVKKGEKAIELCMPVTGKRTGDDGEETCYTRFIFRRNWFTLAQTEGAEYEPPAPAGWNKAEALRVLDVTEQPFDLVNGNVQGYARDRVVSISPLAVEPFRTLVHEVAHVVLGHTAEQAMSDDERTPRDIREVEAECVAMLVCAALNEPGVEYSRGYVQHWYQGSTIPDESARRILKTADVILRAGRDESEVR